MSNRYTLKQKEVSTNGEAEVIGIGIFVDNKQIGTNSALMLETMTLTNTNCLVVEDFNSHPERLGYQDSIVKGGQEVEQWEIDTT